MDGTTEFTEFIMVCVQGAIIKKISIIRLMVAEEFPFAMNGWKVLKTS
jgi:hypothetical protein